MQAFSLPRTPTADELCAKCFRDLIALALGCTPDNLVHPELPGFPRIHQLGPSGFAWVGCNGRAVALSISLGREPARATQGAPIDTLGLPLSEPKPQPLQPIVRRIAPFALPLYRRLDAREI